MNFLNQEKTNIDTVDNNVEHVGHLPMDIALQSWELVKDFHTHKTPQVIGQALQLINKNLHVSNDKHIYGNIILKPEVFYQHMATFYATHDSNAHEYTDIMLYLEIIVKMQAE